MKFEALRRSVVSYFRRPATSVPPKTGLEIAEAQASDDGVLKIDADEIGDQILKQLLESGVLRGHVNRAHPQAERVGIKPPPDTTDNWTWSKWSNEVAANGTIPGWAYCRFAHRLGGEGVGFVFGHVRGGFGVWRQPFDVCTGHDEGVQQASKILTCVTHLQSGLGIGIFIDRTTAILAAELAERVCPGWESDAPERLWSAYMDRTLSAWHSLGICRSSNAHAHDSHGNQFPIYGQDNESVMAGKPERLS